MNIIPAKAADYETVRQITEETIQTVYPHYYPAGAVAFFLAHHNAAAIMRDITENCVFLCISDSGEITGTVTVSGNEIGRLFVLPQYQGNGYGREAMKLALDFIRTFPAGEATYCWLSYEPTNEVARKLYLSFGFEEHPEHYEEGDEMPAILKL